MIPGSRRSPGEGNGKPLQYSCLEKPMDRGAWRATVHGVTKTWTQLKQLSMHGFPENKDEVGVGTLLKSWLELPQPDSRRGGGFP